MPLENLCDVFQPNVDVSVGTVGGQFDNAAAVGGIHRHRQALSHRRGSGVDRSLPLLLLAKFRLKFAQCDGQKTGGVLKIDLPRSNSVLEYHSPQKSWRICAACRQWASRASLKPDRLPTLGSVPPPTPPSCDAAQVEVQRPGVTREPKNCWPSCANPAFVDSLRTASWTTSPRLPKRVRAARPGEPEIASPAACWAISLMSVAPP